AAPAVVSASPSQTAALPDLAFEAPQPANRRRKPLFRRLIAVAAAVLFLAVAVAAGGLYRLQPDKGAHGITTESDDVEVVVKQGGQVVRIIDTKTDKEITLALRSGAYELELKGAPKGLKLNIDKATLTRGKTVLAKIERVARPAVVEKVG